MNRWEILKKGYLLLAVVIMLLCAWPVSFYPSKLAPRPVITKIIPETALPAAPVSEYEENYYDIYINDNLNEESVLVLKDKEGNLWLPLTSFDNFNFDTAGKGIKEYAGTKFLSVSQFPGVTYTIDIENLALKLTVPLAIFKTNVVDLGASKTIIPTLPPWGGFLNYNFFGVNTSSTNNLAGLFGLGIFGPKGVGTSTFNWSTSPAPRPWVRLLTTWTIDKPETMQTLALGDVISASTNWSGSVNFAGVQWGRNFATQPAFITFPLPGYRGTAIVPSMMSLYVNQTLAGQQQVKPGPFDITNIPLVDGAGNVRIVTKDILGREQVITANYYINNTLLKKGLTNYTLEAGIIRQDLGIYSNNYSQGIGALTYNVGVTDSTTAGVHAELLSYERALGATLIQLIGDLGVATASTALSHSRALGDGGLGQLAFQRQTELYSVGGSTQYTTNSFTQQGMTEGQHMPKLLNQLFASVIVFDSTLSMNYTKIINRNDTASNTFLTATGSTSLWHAISTTATWQRSFQGPPNNSFFLALSYAYNENVFINGNFTNSNGAKSEALQLVRQLPTGPGYGFDISAQRGASPFNEASLSLQNDIGTYIGQMVQNLGSGGQTTYNVNVQGAAIYMDHHLELSRTMTGSFGYVKLPGYPNVDVYWENQLIGSTNNQGYVMIPNLLPYQRTKVNIDPNTVPLNTHINSYELSAAPYNNAGVLLTFDVKTIANVIMTLKLPGDAFVPEGSSITIEGSEEPAVVGTGGELFLTNLSGAVKGKAEWEGGTCTFGFNTPAPNPNDMFPNIGAVACQPQQVSTTSQVTPPPPTAQSNVPTQGASSHAVGPTN